MRGRDRVVNKRFFLLVAILVSNLLIVLCGTSSVFSYPVRFTDAQRNNIIITERPVRVVSLVPSITEIICRIGAGDTLKAITYHSTYPPETVHKEIIGGFFSPSLKILEKIHPDIIFVSRHQEKARERFGAGECQLINLETDSISDSYENILLLGMIFDRETEAARIVDELKGELQTIARKVAKIPRSQRKRVIRLMGRELVMAPGDDSFQNEMIRAAGGVPPALGKKGNIVVVSREEWMRFNPQVIYGCGADRETAKRFFNRPGWKDVEAVKNGKIFYFPCDLTCRASTNTGYFLSWLSSRIYPDEFSNKEKQILKDHIFGSRHLDLDLDHIKEACVTYSYIDDFLNKTLIIDFKEPLTVVSTLEGQRSGIISVGNHYSPPPCWAIGHKLGLKRIREQLYQVIGKTEDTASFLFTGADMDNLAIKHERFREMEVYALVTAGVKSNAVRMSKDEGRFYEPGTINIILLSNMKLTTRAMTRAIISATEAKTAALMDMDVRSSATPRIHQATGTGTDNFIVVEGTGKQIDNTGGHSKMGELIAKAVYEAVQEAVYKQGSLVAQRNIFQRLKERNINIFGLISVDKGECNVDKYTLIGALEEILLQPQYASFIKASLAISDNYERGLISDLSVFELWCRNVAEEIAGREIESMSELIAYEDMPCVLRMVLNSILNGLYLRLRQKS